MCLKDAQSTSLQFWVPYNIRVCVQKDSIFRVIDYNRLHTYVQICTYVACLFRVKGGRFPCGAESCTLPCVRPSLLSGRDPHFREPATVAHM